jgi:hypothetical protein
MNRETRFINGFNDIPKGYPRPIGRVVKYLVTVPFLLVFLGLVLFGDAIDEVQRCRGAEENGE